MRPWLHRGLLQWLGICSLVLLILSGCGGSSGTGGDASATSRVSILIRHAEPAASTRQSHGATPSPIQGRQVQPGDPGFITRLEIRVTAPDLPNALITSVPLTEEDQTQVAVELLVPRGNNRLFSITTFNADNIGIFRGATTVNLTNATAQVVLTLVRGELIPRAITLLDLEDQAFRFGDAPALFGLAPAVGEPLIAFGNVVDTSGAFILTAGDFTASGLVTLGSCLFTVEGSTFPPAQGPQIDDQIVLDPCDIDAVDGRLIVHNATLGEDRMSDPPIPSPFIAIPTVSITDTTVEEGDTDTVAATFVVHLSEPSNHEVQVDFATQDDTAVAGTDYQAASGTLVFPAGTVEQTLTVEVMSDTLEEPDTTFRVMLRNPIHAIHGTRESVGTIIDDDAPSAVPSLSLTDAHGVEGPAGTVAFTVRLSAPSPLPITVEFTTRDDTAVADRDYGPRSGILMFAPGDTAQPLIIALLDDALNEAEETFQVLLSNATNATLADAQGIGTIADDDPRPTLSVANVEVTEGNSDRQDAIFIVHLAAASGQHVMVDFQTQDGTALAGRDYEAVQGTLSFPPDTTSQTITVPVLGDTLDETDETFRLLLSNPQNAIVETNAALGIIRDDDDDDERPRLHIVDATVTEGDSGTVTATFTVTLEPVSRQIVTVGFITQDGTAMAERDYQPASGSLTFSPGDTTRTIGVTVRGDTLDEDDETFLITLRNPTNALLARTRALGTIRDDDGPPRLTITDGQFTEGNSGTTAALFTVTLSAPSAQIVTVDFLTQDGTARADRDYQPTTDTLTFPPGVTTQTLPVFILGDTLDEAEETFTVRLRTPTNATLGDASGLGTIIDDDPVPRLTVTPVTVTEGNSDTTLATFTVTLLPASGQVVTVDFATQDDTAVADSDYHTTSGRLTFAPGRTSHTITVPVVGDTLDEPEETFRLILSNPQNTTLDTTEVLGTIRNDDASARLRIADVTVTEGDSGTSTATFTVTLAPASSQQVTVAFTTQDGTATANSDYQPTDGTVTFAPGTTAQTVVVQVRGDTLNEADETVVVLLSNPRHATLADARGVGTITDDDPLPSVALTPVTVPEGDSGTSLASFTVTLTPASGQTVTVDFVTQNDTALADSDYQTTRGTLTFPPGITARLVTVPIRGDTLIEADEAFRLVLRNPQHARVRIPEALGIIRDDDGPARLRIEDVTVPEGDNDTSTATFTVTLTPASNQSVTVAFITQDGTARAGSDYRSTRGTLIFAPGITAQTLSVQVRGDTFNEVDETFAVVLSAPTNARLADARGVGTITDDDPVPRLALAPATIVEGDSGTSAATFTITLTPASGQQVTVAFTTQDGTATASSDYQATSGTLTFAPGTTAQTVVVQIHGDTLTEADETFHLILRNPQHATVSTSDVLGTIRDDDPARLRISNATVPEGDQGNSTITFTVTLTPASSQQVTVAFTTQDGTATASSDYHPTSGTLTFAPGTTAQTVAVPIRGDTLNEADETVVVLLNNPRHATLADARGVGTITDDDPLPSLTLVSNSIPEGDSGISTISFTVTLTPASGQRVTVDFATEDGTARAPGDYHATSGTLNFPPGITTQAVTVNVLGDTPNEADETFAVLLSTPTNAILATPQGSGTLVNDDPLPTLTIADVGTPLMQAAQRFAVVDDPQAIAVGDVNGDTRLDIVTANAVSADVAILLGNGDGTLQTPQTLAVGADPRAVAMADVNGDTHLDLLTANRGSDNLTVLLGNGDGTFPASQTIAVGGSGPSAVTAVDVNGDTHLDLLTANRGSDNLTVLLGNGDGTFQSPHTFAAGRGAGALAVADVNGDTQIDVVTANAGANNVAVLLGNGDGTFQAPQRFATGNMPVACAITDVNGDLRLDLVTANQLDGAIAVLLGNGDGTFQAPQGFSVGREPMAVTVTDFNSDGMPDLAVANFGSNNLAVLLGNGNGTFQAPRHFPVRSGPTFVAAAELNNDARVDLVTTLTTTDAVAVLLNNVALEGNADRVPVTFVAQLDAPSGREVTVAFATQDATAMAGTDYQATQDTLIIPAGMTTQSITVNLLGDTLDEADETFVLLLSNPTHAALANDQAIGTLTDDDPLPRLTISDATRREGDTGFASLTFTISLDTPSLQMITVEFATQDGTAVASTDYQAISDTLTFPAGITTQTLTVNIIGDTLHEADETFVVLLSHPTNAMLANTQGSGTIANDDPLPVLSITNVTRSEEVETVIFTVSLDAASGEPVTVDFLTRDGTATAGADYLDTRETLRFPPGTTTQEIIVPLLDDTVDEADETFTILLRAPTNATLRDDQGRATITDDDPPPRLSLAPVTVFEGDSGMTTATFTGTLSGPSAQTITVDFATQDNTALAPSDYQVTRGTLIFPPGTTTRTIAVPIVDDTLDESDETFRLTLTTPQNVLVDTPEVLGLIRDDDAAPSMRITDVSVTEGNSDTTLAAFTVALNAASGRSITVDFTTQNGTARAGRDYEASRDTLTFLPGILTRTVTVPILGDTLDEPDETVIVLLHNAVNATLTTDRGVGTITDDDPVPRLTLAPVTAPEGDSGTSPVPFIVTLSTASARTVTVDFATQNGTALRGRDYHATSSTLTFPPGTTTQTIIVSVVGDTLDEADETFRLILSNPHNALLETSEVSGTITDDDAAARLTISNATVTEGDTATFTVTLTPVSGQTVTVDFATQNGTALAGSDYQVARNTLTFPPGTTTQTVTVTILRDTLDEANETFAVQLQDPTNARLGDARGVGTITDNDPAPSLTLTPVSVTEGDSAPGTATFTVTLTPASGRTVTVDFATHDITARTGMDYQEARGTVTFPPGTTTQPVIVTIIGDTLDEANETFRLTLSNPQNATVDTANALGTISDDDPPAGLRIDNAILTEGNSEPKTLTFTVSLTPASGRPVTVDFATQNGTALAGRDYQTARGSLTFAPGTTSQAITVTVLGDTLDEENETFSVLLQNPTNARLTQAQGIGTINDNDSFPSLTLAPITVTEGASPPGTATFTITLTPASGRTVTVDFATQNGTAFAGTDYQAASGTVTFSPGTTARPVVVTILDDTLDEAAETFRLVLSNPQNVMVGTPSAHGTIRDDDALPSLGIDNATIMEGDSRTATFTITLDPASGRTVTVDFATENGTALAGSDYQAASGTLTFDPGTTSRTVILTILSDPRDEDSETFFVRLRNPTNARLANDRGVGTILDNDPVPTLTLSPVTVPEGDTGPSTATFTVTLTPVSDRPVSVDFATQNGTAMANSDYQAAHGSVTFAPGTTTRTIDVTIIGDTLDEANETFRLTLSTPQNARVGTPSALGTITDDDAPVSLGISNVAVTEGDTEPSTATFTATLIPVSGLTVTVEAATANGTALAGSDYQAISATLTFAPGVTTQTFTVNVLGDLLDEPAETFFVTLSNPTNATLANNQATGTINDNDPPQVNINDVTVTENDRETVTATFTVSLSSAIAQAVSVNFATQDATATLQDNDYVGKSGMLTIPAGVTTVSLTVDVVGDLLDEADETFLVNLSSPANATLGDAQGIGTILDNDPFPSLDISNAIAAEGNLPSGGVVAVFQVTLSDPSGRTVTVDVATQNNTAVAGTDYQATNTTLTFTPGTTSRPVQVPLIGNLTAQPNRTFQVNLSQPRNAVFGDAQGVGTIQDDDPLYPGPKFALGTATAPVALATADLNGDTFADLVTANASTDDVTVFLTRFVGPFQAPQSFSVGAESGPAALAIADVDGNTFPDLVVANQFAGTIAVLLGTGDGTFQLPPTSFPVASSPSSSFPSAVAIADLNGDTFPDVVTANTEANSVSVLLGRGDGTFGSGIPLAVGAAPIAVALADVTGDTRVDVVTANSGSDNLTLLQGNGAGTFEALQPIVLGFTPQTVAVADLNADTVLDLITAEATFSTWLQVPGHNVVVLLGQGAGLFQPPQAFAVESGPRAVAVVDFDGDTNLDIVSADQAADTISVLLGMGDGTFLPARSFSVGQRPAAVVTLDLNQDTAPDIAIANEGSGDISVLLGDGTGSFRTYLPVAIGTAPVAIATGSFAGAFADFVTANSGTGDLTVLFGNGAGTFLSTPLSPGPNVDPTDVAVGTFDANAFADIVTIGSHAPSESDVALLFLSNGNGTFQQPVPLDPGSSILSAVVVADLDGDAVLDIVTANSFAASVSILLGNGNGTFQPARLFSTTITADDLAVGDLDGDAILDLIVMSSSFGSSLDQAVVLPGNGDGTFNDPLPALELGTFSTDIALANLDGDPALDLIVVNNDADSVSIFFGNGDGTFQPCQDFPVRPGPNSVAVSDVDGDTMLDLLVTHVSTNDVVVLRSNGDGTFQAPVAFAIGVGIESFTTAIAVADVNGDGRPDIATANSGGGVSILLHQ